MDESERTEKLARKNSWATALLTLFFLPIGYIYTGRYKALLTGFGIAVGVMALCFVGDPSLEDDEDFTTGFGFIYTVIATVENTRAVNKAKRQTKGNSNPGSEDIRVQLIKIAHKMGEVTLSDLVVETGRTPQEIRTILEELQREDLMRIHNRSRDGAVVYSAV